MSDMTNQKKIHGSIRCVSTWKRGKQERRKQKHEQNHEDASDRTDASNHAETVRRDHGTSEGVCPRSEAHEQSGSAQEFQRKRDACIQTMATSETGRTEWMVLCGSFFSVSEPVEDKSPEVNDEEYMLSMVNNDEEREDVSSTTSERDVNPRWLKVCKKKSKKMMRMETQETLDLNAVHSTDEEKITITIDSGAAASAMPKDMLPNVPKSAETRNKFYWVANGSKIPYFGGKKITHYSKESTHSMNF